MLALDATERLRTHMAEQITRKQLAEVLGCSTRTIDRMVLEADVPYIRVKTFTGSGTRVRFVVREIQAWLAKRIDTNLNN